MSAPDAALPEVDAIARGVRDGALSAERSVDDALARIADRDTGIHAFTAVLADRARQHARALDHRIAARAAVGPLAGVPFAVKNLFDIEGLTTLAGSIIAADNAPAQRDAALIRRLEAADAVLVGALNMDEFAFGFSTQNSHYGPTRNPHATDRIAGGSSGGSAAAVAAGMLPFTLGSDTNGSIRVPAALCGVFGLRPTYGRLSRAGTLLFSASMDAVGPFARSTTELAAIYDILQGPDIDDPALVDRPIEVVTPCLGLGIAGLRIGIAAGYFESAGFPEAIEVVGLVAAALGATQRIELPRAAIARGAAMLITGAEGADLHLDALRTRSADFDPMTRHMFLSGALIPAPWYARAQRFRRAWCGDVARVFDQVDVLLAPATPYAAFPIGQATVRIGALDLPASGHLGVYTQPLSFAGLPVIAAPVAHQGPLPLGVQIVAAPWREDLVFRVAREAERLGVLRPPPLPHC